MSDLTSGEQAAMRAIAEKLGFARLVLNESQPSGDAKSESWYSYLTQLKFALGNFDNDISFVATLMAKRYLHSVYELERYDAAAKSQSAPGLDLDVRTLDGRRIIGEIKTTFPYQMHDLGAQQKKTFLKDFEKLNGEQAHEKYFFVTEETTFQVVGNKYGAYIPGVRLVLLPRGPEMVPPHA